jgi:hypothetical protein
MSTFFTRDGEELELLIKGDIPTWDAVKFDWDDRLLDYCQRILNYHDAELAVHEAWRQVTLAVMRWKPGVDTRKDVEGNSTIIDRALTLSYVKRALRNLVNKANEKQQKQGGSAVSLDMPVGPKDSPLASITPDRKDHNLLPDAPLFAFVAELETKRLGDEDVAIALVQALLDEGLLLPRALEWLIELADPALDDIHQQVVIRRWLLAQDFWQIGYDLTGNGVGTEDTEKRKVHASWASNQHQAALKRMRRGIESAQRG